jgi:uncharacterized protein
MRTLVMLLLCTSTAAAQDPLSGTWHGYWSRMGDTMDVTLAVRRDSAGRYSATFSADRLRVTGIPFTQVEVQGRCDVKLLLRGDRTTMEFTGTIRGDSVVGAFQEGASPGRFAYARVATQPPAVEEREITFANGAVTLAGSLLLPNAARRDKPIPGVVFLHGSGAEGRWASRYVATDLAAHGIAALIFDKRGVGRSTGNWREATTDDLVGDAVAFVVASAGAGLPPDSVELFSVLNSVLPEAGTAEDSAAARAYVSELVAVAYHGRARGRLDSLVTAWHGRPWFIQPPPPADAYWSFSRSFAQVRPIDWWRRVRVPVLLLYGAADQRVPPNESARRIEDALRGAGNRNVTVRIFPGADHTFRLPPAASGWPVTAPGYLRSVRDWFGQQAR